MWSQIWELNLNPNCDLVLAVYSTHKTHTDFCMWAVAGLQNVGSGCSYPRWLCDYNILMAKRCVLPITVRSPAEKPHLLLSVSRFSSSTLQKLCGQAGAFS